MPTERVRFWDIDREVEPIDCACGRKIVLRYNGGELDSVTCDCGRLYNARHMTTVIEVTTPMLTVRDVMEKLSQLPMDALVAVHDDSDIRHVTEVRIIDEELADDKSEIGKVLIW